MKATTSKILILTLFFTVLIFPVVASDKVGGGVSPNENRYLAKFPSVIVEKNRIAPGLKNGFEAWLKDNLAGREQAQRLKAIIDFNVFSVSPSPLVHIGKEGWYFFTGDHNLEIGRGTEMLSNDQLMEIRTNQEAIQRSLKEQGIDYVLVFVPSKASVYPEYIGGGEFQVGKTLIDQVTAYMEENTTIPIINLKPDLVAGKAQQDVYFRTDTHWNHAGAYIGYEAIVKRLNELGMIETPSVNIATRPATFIGDLSIMTGFPGLLPPDQYEESVIQNLKATQFSDNAKVNQVNTLLSENDIKEECKSYSNPSAEKTALILGDSYFFAWQIPQLLAENFSEMNFIRTEIIVGDVIRAINPDIVILERTERYIYSLANPATIRINIPRLSNSYAEIVSQNTPSTMKPGESYVINIVVKNSGQQSWSEDNQIRLGIFQDGKDTGFRVYLPFDLTVEPGQEFTFILENFAAPEPGATYLEYQMLQEGIQYFGEKERVDIVVK